MSEVPIFLQPPNNEEAPPIKQKEIDQPKQIEKKKKATANNPNKMGNSQNNKRIDTTLYKKIFYNNLKDVCTQMFPQNKNFSNEKYQNFKNIYHKIHFYKRSGPDRFPELLDEYVAASKKANEIKKINHKNYLIKLLIQKMESQQNKVAFKQIAEEIGCDVKADYIEKIYDSIDVSDMKDFDKDKTLDHFFQRNQIKEINKKRTRKQMDKNPSISSENMKISEPSIKDIKEEPSDKIRSMFDLDFDNNPTATFLNLQETWKTLKEKSKDLGSSHLENVSVASDLSKFNPNPTTFLEGCLNNDIVAENVDPHETNLIKIANRNILSKLNKFCSYDFTQTNALIPHIGIGNEKKQPQNLGPGLKHSNSSQLTTPEFLKKMENLPPKLLNNESEDANENSSKHNFINDEAYAAAATAVNFPTSFPNFYNNETQYSNPENCFGSLNKQMPSRKTDKNKNTVEFQTQTHPHHSHHYHHSNSGPKMAFNPTEGHHSRHDVPHPKDSVAYKNYSKLAKKKAKKSLEKKTHFSSHEASNPHHTKQPHVPTQTNSHHSERSEPAMISQGMSFAPNTSMAKAEGVQSFPQQYFSIVSLDKDLQNNRRSCQVPQIYQATQQYRPNAYYFNGPQDNNYINGNVISTNNFCFQAGNPNHFVGVNYPNVQNIAFTKPSNYQAYGVVDLNNDASANQFGFNYVNENRTFQDKNRNGNEYWKPATTYYTFNSQN